ncbi:MAG TPA: thiolase family protein [Anaeromyxobacteraceae bacterium]|nr:thiolase family protein [Anaeromyxobacteraceae bacterium]
MKEVFVVDAARTPFGSLGGALADVPAPRLAAPVIARLLERGGVRPEQVERVLIGEVLTAGVGQAPARQAMRAAGLPDSVPATTVNKVCGSGLEAMALAAASIRAGDVEIAVAGGMENMSLAPYALARARQGYRLGNGEVTDLLVGDGLTDPYDGRHMGAVADAAAARTGIDRAAQDEYAIRSYRLAQQAIEGGIFEEELVPVRRRAGKGEETVARDEEPFRVDLAKLPRLRPVFTEGGTVTAGNASSINDGAALALLASGEAVKSLRLAPKARLVATATHSMSPDRFTDAPVGAIEAVCRRAGLKLAEIDLFEINEAFALVPLIAIRELRLPPEKVNPNGGAVAIGHPIGASGGRLAATVVRELRRRGLRYGLATLCIGGGEAVAAIFERI